MSDCGPHDPDCAGDLPGLPFAGVAAVSGWTHGASFRPREDRLSAFVDYERWILEELRGVQRTLWHHLRDEGSATHGGEVRLGRALVSRLACELWSARVAVDVEAGRPGEVPPAAAAMRAVPICPPGVREYPDAEAFVAEDPAREALSWSDHGDRWLLEHPLRRWELTRWRVAWLAGATDEVCAVELLDADDARTTPGRVWLLGAAHSRPALRRALGGLERTAQGERNSLVLVADAIARASREWSIR